MIRIIGFDDYLAPDVKRGRVKHPRWFRQKCQLSPEAQLLLMAEGGPAMYGIWCLLQAWAMRHPKRGGVFACLTGEPLSYAEIAAMIGVPGSEHLVRATISRVSKIGWMSVDDVQTSSIETPDKLPTESFLEERRRRGDNNESISSRDVDLSEMREENSEPLDGKKIAEEMVELMRQWKGSSVGLLEARLIDSVVKEATESPVGENCPQRTCTALLRRAVSSGVAYQTPEVAEMYLKSLLGVWRDDGQIPEEVQTESREVYDDFVS